jgi:hypothetical protein
LFAGGILGGLALAGLPGVASAEGGGGPPEWEPPIDWQSCPSDNSAGSAFALALSGFGRAHAECKTGDTGHNTAKSESYGGDSAAFAQGDATSGDTGDSTTNVNGQSGNTGSVTSSQTSSSSASSGNGGNGGNADATNGSAEGGDGGSSGHNESRSGTYGDAESGDSEVEQKEISSDSGDSGKAVSAHDVSSQGGNSESKSKIETGNSGPAFGLAIAPFGDANASARSGDTGHNTAKSESHGGDSVAVAKGDATSGDTGNASTNVNGQSGDTGSVNSSQTSTSTAQSGDGGKGGNATATGSGGNNCGCEPQPTYEKSSMDNNCGGCEPPPEKDCGCPDATGGDGGNTGHNRSKSGTYGDAESGDSEVEQKDISSDSGDSGKAVSAHDVESYGGDSEAKSKVETGDSGPERSDPGIFGL